MSSGEPRKIGLEISKARIRELVQSTSSHFLKNFFISSQTSKTSSSVSVKAEGSQSARGESFVLTGKLSSGRR